MMLRQIIVHIIFPMIMLIIGVLGILSPSKIDKSRYIIKSYNSKILEKNERTHMSAVRCNCICLLLESIFCAVLSFKVFTDKVLLTSFETFMLVIIMVILPLPIMYLVHFIRFDKNGNLRREKE